MAGNVNPFHMLYMRLRQQNSDVLCSIVNRLFTEGRVLTTLTQDLRLLVLEEAELSIDQGPKASTGKTMARTPYFTVRDDPQPQPPPQEAPMAKEPEPVEYEEEEDPKPTREVIPVDDLDRIETLLNVALLTVDTPNLTGIRQACQEELAQLNTALVESQTKANEVYTRELAEWESKQQQKAEAKRKAQEAEEQDDATRHSR